MLTLSNSTVLINEKTDITKSIIIPEKVSENYQYWLRYYINCSWLNNITNDNSSINSNNNDNNIKEWWVNTQQK